MKPQTAQPRQLELTPEDMAKVLKRKRQVEASKIKVPPEELFVAEFGVHFGWEGMVALMNNQITMDDAQSLLAGARKVWDGRLVDMASVIFTANAAVQSGKNAQSVMTKGLDEFVKQARADL